VKTILYLKIIKKVENVFIFNFVRCNFWGFKHFGTCKFITFKLPAKNLIKISKTQKGTSSLFEIIPDRVEQLQVNLSITDWSGLKIRKLSKNNNTRGVFGDVIFHIPLSDEIELEVKLYKKQGRGKKIYF
jgi:hypothetical protein